MKVTLFALFAGLVMIGCGDSNEIVDLEDPEIRKRITSNAIDANKLSTQWTNDHEFYRDPENLEPYEGWVKGMHKNGKLRILVEVKEGKADGLWMEWDLEGRKAKLQHMERGKKEGLLTRWHENGKKSYELNYANGKMQGVETTWWSNGQKHTEKVMDGWKQGLTIFYNLDGTEKKRYNPSLGESVKDAFKPATTELIDISNKALNTLHLVATGPVDRIIISDDGFSPKKYYQYRGVDMGWNQSIEIKGPLRCYVSSCEFLAFRIGYGPLKEFKGVGPEKFNWDNDDPKLDSLIALAINRDKLSYQAEKTGGKLIMTLEGKPYSGWLKSMHKNGTINFLSQYKDGKSNGLYIQWDKHGRKRMERNYKDGKEEGLQTDWYSNGWKRDETFYRNGKCVARDTWKINGENCPVTDWKNGSGIVVIREDDGSEKHSISFKNGNPISYD